MAKPIENMTLDINIDSADAALTGSEEEVRAELKRVLQKCIDHLEVSFEIETYEWLYDLNGNKCGTISIDATLKDIIEDRDEWIQYCKDVLEEVGFTLNDHHNTVLHDWDQIAEADYDGLNEWYSNYTDVAITQEIVVPEASGWDWE